MKPGIFYGFLLVCIGSLFGQNRVDISGSVEWTRMEMSAAVTVNLSFIGIRLPTGRIQAEAIINDEYPYLVRPYLLSLPVDSSSTVEDLLNRGEFSIQNADNISFAAQKIHPTMSEDLSTMSARYTLNLNNLSSQLIRHSYPMDTVRILTPTPVTSYSGIIIIADEALPIHGRNTTAIPLPCIFPKIWDTKMNLIYERNMVDPENVDTMVHYTSRNDILHTTPSGLEENLIRVVGSNPLRIIARGVFGIRPTDPIIDERDALVILSSEHNRRLLREGKVVIVLNSNVLKDTF